MPPITDLAIVIRRWDFSETSQTVSLFTREHGVVRGIAKGAKRERGMFSGGMDVLTRGQVVAIMKPGRDLATLTAWHLQETYRVLRQRLDANRAGLYMADLVHHLLTDHDPHPLLFDALDDALVMLACVSDCGPVLLGLQWKLLGEVGYRPELDQDAETGASLPDDAETLCFSARAGGLVVEGGGPACWRVRAGTVAALRAVARSEELRAHDPVAVGRANRLLAAYSREIVGAEIPAARWAFSDLDSTPAASTAPDDADRP